MKVLQMLKLKLMDSNSMESKWLFNLQKEKEKVSISIIGDTFGVLLVTYIGDEIGRHQETGDKTFPVYGKSTMNTI